MRYNKVKVKELTQNKRKEGQYAEPKAKEKRPLVDTTKSHSHSGDHSPNRRDTPTLIQIRVMHEVVGGGQAPTLRLKFSILSREKQWTTKSGKLAV